MMEIKAKVVVETKKKSNKKTNDAQLQQMQ